MSLNRQVKRPFDSSTIPKVLINCMNFLKKTMQMLEQRFWTLNMNRVLSSPCSLNSPEAYAVWLTLISLLMILVFFYQ